MKTIYFLCGLPRAGNTLLASILNQNKKISVTANSIVPDIFFSVQQLKEVEGYKVFPDKKSLENVLHNIFGNYYSDWESDYIIDRASWGLNNNLNNIHKYCNNDIKIILLLRNVENILASFIKWSEENKNSFLNQFSDTEEKCNFLMRKNGHLNLSLLSCYNIFTSSENFIVINYDDLIVNPQYTIDTLYSFLEIPPYSHRYTDLNQFSIDGHFYNDKYLGDNLHNIKTEKIEKSFYEIEDYLPKKIINQYSQFNFWK